MRRSSRKTIPRAAVDNAQVDEVARQSLEAFERQGESPYQVQHDLQDMMQDLVGIVRREDEMERALDGIAKLKQRAAKVGISGNREYNPGLAHGARFEQSADRFRSHRAGGDRAQGKPRRAFPRRLSGEGSGLRQHSIS